MCMLVEVLMSSLEHNASKGDTTWFTQDRFGMFIHWGLYAMGARHEWLKTREEMTTEQYSPYFDYFDPDLYDPGAWADAAAYAGMKYVVATTKHHDGFCLWDSSLTAYKSTNTPAKRDLIRPMVDAFRARGLRTGLYHSLIDWHHPDFTIDRHHPQRNHPERESLDASKNMERYRAYLHGQVQELLTGYGDIDILWCDFSYPPEKGCDAWGSHDLYRLIRELQPHIILNDRMDLPSGWDIKTPEQFQPRHAVQVDGSSVVWEACQTLSGSWGYHRDEASWKSTPMLIQMLIDTVSMGGNVLLNVGPTGRGEFDIRTLDRLRGIGDWMRYHSRSIYGCTDAPTEFGQPPRDCRYTWNPVTKRLYVHVFAWPFGQLYLDGIAPARIRYAQLLNDASEVLRQDIEPWQHDFSGEKQGMAGTALRLPILRPDVTVPVIEIMFHGEST